jgi:signal recognition particle subunit SRP54
MTKATLPERNRPDVLNGSRKRRISMGSGTSVAEINRLLKQYKQMQKMMKGVQGKWLRRAMGSGAGMQG